jgi:hypothetical protein
VTRIAVLDDRQRIARGAADRAPVHAWTVCLADNKLTIATLDRGNAPCVSKHDSYPSNCVNCSSGPNTTRPGHGFGRVAAGVLPDRTSGNFRRLAWRQVTLSALRRQRFAPEPLPKGIADQLSPSCRQYTRVRRCGGRLKTCSLWTRALAPPSRFTAPMPILITCPSTSTSATVGDEARRRPSPTDRVSDHASAYTSTPCFLLVKSGWAALFHRAMICNPGHCNRGSDYLQVGTPGASIRR